MTHYRTNLYRLSRYYYYHNTGLSDKTNNRWVQIEYPAIGYEMVSIVGVWLLKKGKLKKGHYGRKLKDKTIFVMEIFDVP